MQKLTEAIALVEQGSKDKLRKTGEPYSQHCHNVIKILQNHGFENENLLVAAMLHGICEDTDAYNPEIQKRFGDRVGFIVDILSKNKKPKRDKLKRAFEPDATYKTFEEYMDFRFLMYINRFYMGVLADPYILFIKMADQIDDIGTVEIRSNEAAARKIKEIRRYFLPMYKKIYNKNVLTPKYEKKYLALKNLLVKIIKEKEEILQKRLQV